MKFYVIVFLVLLLIQVIGITVPLWNTDDADMSVKKNFIYNVGYQILAVILPLVTAPYLSRVLEKEGLGTYSYTYSVAYYFVLFAMLGVNNYGNRAIAVTQGDKNNLSKTFWSIWILQAALSLWCLGIYIFYSIVVTKNSVYALIWVPYVISAGLDVNWLFFGLEKFKMTVSRNFIIKILTFAFTFIFVRGNNALMYYLVLMSVSLFLSAAVLWPFVWKEIPFMAPSITSVLRHLKPDLVLFVPVIAVSLYTVLDKVMLGQMAGMGATGVFANSLNVAQMPFTLIAALGTVMLPHSSSLYASGYRTKAIDHMAPSMWFAMLLSSAFTFGLVAVASEFVPVFFGAGFEACMIVMPVIVLEMPFTAWANVIRTQWLIPAQKDRAYVISVVAGAIVNLVVNLFLIPSLGALGAGIGTLFAEVSVCIVQSFSVRKQLPLLKWVLESIPGLTIGCLMFVIVRVVAQVVTPGAFGLLIEILLGSISFIIMCGLWFFGTRNRYATELILPLFKKLLFRARRNAIN